MLCRDNGQSSYSCPPIIFQLAKRNELTPVRKIDRLNALTSESLSLFLAVVDHGSFSAAARATGRVPSAVSMAIANLEAELDFPLFDRSGREPKPTPQALSLVPQARQILAKLQELNAHALELSEGLEDSLTLAVVPELLSTPWAACLKLLSERHPLLELQVITVPQHDAVRMVQEQLVDMALVYERNRFDDRERFEELGQEHMVMVASPDHPLSAMDELREDHLEEFRQIAVAGRGFDRSNARFIWSRNLWRADNHVTALAMVKAGIGWAYMPLSFVKAEIEAGSLVRLQFANLTNEVTIWVDLLWPSTKPMGPAARLLVDLFRQQRR